MLNSIPNVFSKIGVFLIPTLSYVSAATAPNVQHAVQERNLKQAITLQKEVIEKSNLEAKSESTYELALLYLKDQDQENAFQTFLTALDQPPSTVAKGKMLVRQPDLDATSEKLLNIYLDYNSTSPQETALKLIETATATKDNISSPSQEYLIAIAYANLGRYEEFFQKFYKAYLEQPDHYLAYKTKAILHIKLLERKIREEERSIQREAIVENLTQAVQREPKDASIYRMLISFSQKEKKRENLRRSLNKIVNDNIMIPRGDVMFYVQEGLDAGEIVLTQKFLCCSHKWYPQSRMVTTAQEYFNAATLQKG